MKKHVLVFLLLIVIVSAGIAQSRLSRVAVIAPSISTRQEAREILRENWMMETSYNNADAILVVVRSTMLNPLNIRYRSIKDLERAANMQMNISGLNFHVYLYQINSDESVREIYHDRYKAN
jgi:predicted small secreted protein